MMTSLLEPDRIVPGELFPQYVPMTGDPREPPFRIVTESHLQREWFSMWKAVKVSCNTQRWHSGAKTSHSREGLEQFPTDPIAIMAQWFLSTLRHLTLTSWCFPASIDWNLATISNSSYLAWRQNWKRNSYVQNWHHCVLTIFWN